MTINIHIELHPERGGLDLQLKQAMQALGYERSATATPITSDARRHTFEVPEGEEAVRDEEGRATGETRPVTDPAPARERGKPSQGRARRTKEEIAEDEAADQTDITANLNSHGYEATSKTKDGRDVYTKPGISSGAEDRIDPENPEVEAQDKADEQAEVATTASSTLNHDDIRAVLGKYVKAYGIDAAQEDGPKLISLVCGEGKSKVSDVPDDLIAKVVAGVEEMLTKNPYKRAADL